MCSPQCNRFFRLQHESATSGRITTGGEVGLPDRFVMPAGFRERRSLVAIVTNHESQRVINRFGVPNRKDMYGRTSVAWSTR